MTSLSTLHQKCYCEYLFHPPVVRPISFEASSTYLHSPIHTLRPDLFRQSVGVVLYVPRQMYMTGAAVFVEKGRIEEVLVHQDVIDKVGG